MDIKNITILCKVVDNFGDIGFVYRLARAINELDTTVRLRLVVSDVASFSALAPQVDANKPEQTCYGWQIYDWNADEACTHAFTQDPPAIILECFQCGRPDWLESLLFDDTSKKDTAHTKKNTVPFSDEFVQILNIDYLTAESYADDFHLLKSGTRSARVKKINFMPGFTAHTGGLILDRAFLQSRAAVLTHGDTDDFTAVFFSYERECAPVVRALADFQKKTERRVHVLVAAGKSCAPFLQAWERASKPFAVETLPFLPQEHWDALLCRADWNFVRGEDSLSRACLAGNPFVWQAYPQDEDYHLVKLAALNDRLRPFLPAEAFAAYNAYTRAYNVGKDTSDDLLALLLQADTLRAGFARFADTLVANGNLAEHLLTWLNTLHNP